MFPKSKAATFFLSLIPGVGHLYLGLNKRGLQLLIGAFLSITLIPSFPLVFPFVLVVIWFYAMFDALQKVTLMNYYLTNRLSPHYQTAEEMRIPQHAVPNDPIIDPIKALYAQDTINPLWLGCGSVVIGVIVLNKTLFPNAWDWLFQGHTSAILIAFAMIGFGIWQIRKQVVKP